MVLLVPSAKVHPSAPSPLYESLCRYDDCHQTIEMKLYGLVPEVYTHVSQGILVSPENSNPRTTGRPHRIHSMVYGSATSSNKAVSYTVFPLRVQ